MGLIVDKYYLELTGAPCAGKSVFFESSSKSFRVNGGNVEKNGENMKLHHIAVRVIFFLFGCFYLLVHVRKLIFISAHVFKLNKARFSAFRNSIEKFGCYIIFRNKSVIVDEGISHLPFILQLKNDHEIMEFMNFFRKELSMISVIFLKENNFEILKSRLMFRGHKKINNTLIEELNAFVFMNVKVSSIYASKLKDSFNVTFV